MIQDDKRLLNRGTGKALPEEQQANKGIGCVVQKNLQWNKDRGFEPNPLLDTLYAAVLTDEARLANEAVENTSGPREFSSSTYDGLKSLCDEAQRSANYVDCLSFAQAVMKITNEAFPTFPIQGSSEPTGKTGYSKEEWIRELRKAGLMEHIYHNAKATAQHSPSEKITASLVSFFEAERNKSRFLVYAGRSSEQESWTSTHAMIALGPTLNGDDLWVVHKQSMLPHHAPSITTLKRAISQHDGNYERELKFGLQMALLCPDSFSGSDFNAHLADPAILSVQLSDKLPEGIEILVRGKPTLDNFYFHSLHYAMQNLAPHQLAENGINSEYLSDLMWMKKLSFQQQAVLLNDGRTSGIFDYKSLEALRRRLDSPLALLRNSHQEKLELLEAKRTEAAREYERGAIEKWQEMTVQWRPIERDLDLVTSELIDIQNLVCELERQMLLSQPSQEQCTQAITYLESSTKFNYEISGVNSHLPELKLFLTAYRLAKEELAESIWQSFAAPFLRNVFQHIPLSMSSRYEIEPDDPGLTELRMQEFFFGSDMFNLLGEEGLLQATFREFIADSNTPEGKQGQATKLRAIVSIGDTVYKDQLNWQSFKRKCLSSELITPLQGELEALGLDLPE